MDHDPPPDRAALEAAVGALPGVADAALLDLPGGPALFVALPPAAAPGADRAAVREQLWGKIFDDAYASPLEAADASFNATSFESSYTRAPIPDGELRPVIGGVVDLVLGLRPARVLEVGCGLGMLLFAIAPRCERYVGVDLSASAIAYVDRHLGGLRDRVELRVGGALDIDRMPAGSFDLVLINSTVQYFPGVEYLVAVLQRMERLLAPGGHVVLGDLRGRATLDLLQAALAVHHSDGEATAAALRARARRAVSQERELLLDPSFLLALPAHLPRLGGAAAALHEAPVVNELTQFRYNALLSFDRPAGGEACAWVEAGEGDVVARIREVLARHPGPVGVRGIASARVARAVSALRWLERAPDEATVGGSREALAPVPGGLSPGEVQALGRQLGRATAVAPSPRDREGRFDALFSPAGRPGPGLVPADAYPGAAAVALLPLPAFSADAAWARQRSRLVDAIRQRLGPAAPDRVVLLRSLPRDPSGAPASELLAAAADLGGG